VDIFYVYILKCSDSSYYIGHTDDIEKRVSEHHVGEGSRYISRRLPIELVFLDSFSTRDEAFIMERRIKGWSRTKKEALIEKNWKKIKILAQCKNESRSYPSTPAQDERERSLGWTNKNE